MFKYYKDISDVVSVLACCPSERSYLLTKDPSGECWIPSAKSDKSSWKQTAHKMVSEASVLHYTMFGSECPPCVVLRVHRVWLPGHTPPCAYHAVYKATVKPDLKKKTKLKQGTRTRLQWYTAVELDRQRAHSSLRSPELVTWAATAVGEPVDGADMESGMVVEICEDSVVVTAETAGGAAPSHHHQLLQAAGYGRDDQIRIYREFMLLVYPALYMSPHVFTQFMMDVGWDKSQCSNLFRAADVTGRGGLSFLELLLWAAALEPATQHSGLPAEIRCRYIFRYFDSNRDMKLDYVEFKELVAAARAARQLPVDALSVARDADVCLRQLGLQPNSALPLGDFLRGVGELRLRGTSSLLRSPRAISAYLSDLHGERDKTRDVDHLQVTAKSPVGIPATESSRSSDGGGGVARARPEYRVAAYTARLHRKAPAEMVQLTYFDEDAVSASTARLLGGSGGGAALSLELLSPAAAPVEALAAVHYFASSVERPHRRSTGAAGWAGGGKPALSWAGGGEAALLGTLLLRLAEAVRPLCAAEPRLLRVAAPAYVIGDLHGNLPALLAMEAALWPGGSALAAARLLFLGDFVDRGAYGAELMAYLLASKLQRPRGVLLVRGNHETRDIQKMFTFYNECVTKYGETEGGRIWSAINSVFDVLPLAAVVDDKVFCCHGGIPPPWVCPLISAIDKVPSPLPRPAEQSSVAWELLWNDPVKQTKITATLALELAANEGFAANAKRGTGHVFDQGALDRFLLANRLSHVVRAHEVQQNGFMCQLRGRLVSVFSSSHYCGGNNDSGVALLEDGKLRLIRVGGSAD